jgi:hypothetical protein
MSYSVVGGPAIGFDLTRLAGGRQVAAVLRTALAVRPDDLDRLADRHPGPAPRSEWRRACEYADDAAASMRRTRPLVGPALDSGTAGETALLNRLETGLLGDRHALDRLIRHDVLDWTWLHSGPVAVQDPDASAAADVLVDAAVAGYLRGRLPEKVRRSMATPFVRTGIAARDETAPTPLAPVDRALAVVADADDDVRRRWRAVVDELRVHTAQWAPAMHQATWAVMLAERLRLGCDAQLAGVIAFGRAGFTSRDAAYGVWNAVAGVILALVVSDLLPATDSAVLLRPWRAVYGEDPPARDTT